MSDLLYQTRLRFSGGRGAAILHGRRIELHVAPSVGEFRLVAIDYVPEVHICRVQALAEPWRDMTSDEIAAADALLLRLLGPSPTRPPEP